MKKPRLFILLLIFALAALLFSGCDAVAERMAAGTAVAEGRSPGLPLVPDVGGGANDGSERTIDPIAVATSLQQTMEVILTQTAEAEKTTNIRPTMTQEGAATQTLAPTDEAGKLTQTALAQTLTQAAVPTDTNTPEPTASPKPKATKTPKPTEASQEPTEVPTITPTPKPPCNAFRFVAHVSYPIGSVVQPATGFYKSWQVQNIGRCTWKPDYALVYDSGYQLGGTTPLQLGSGVVVQPEQYVTLTIQLFAPPQPGTYYSYWFLMDSKGNIFGGGPNRDEPLVVQVVVPGIMPPVSTNPVSTAPPFYTSTPKP